MLHGTVMTLGKHEPQIHCFNTVCNLLGRQIDINPGCLEQICSTGHTGYRAVAVFRYSGASGGGYESATRGDVERVTRVATGTHYIDSTVKIEFHGRGQ